MWHIQLSTDGLDFVYFIGVKINFNLSAVGFEQKTLLPASTAPGKLKKSVSSPAKSMQPTLDSFFKKSKSLQPITVAKAEAKPIPPTQRSVDLFSDISECNKERLYDFDYMTQESRRSPNVNHLYRPTSTQTRADFKPVVTQIRSKIATAKGPATAGFVTAKNLFHDVATARAGDSSSQDLQAFVELVADEDKIHQHVATVVKNPTNESKETKATASTADVMKQTRGSFNKILHRPAKRVDIDFECSGISRKEVDRGMAQQMKSMKQFMSLNELDEQSQRAGSSSEHGQSMVENERDLDTECGQFEVINRKSAGRVANMSGSTGKLADISPKVDTLQAERSQGVGKFKFRTPSQLSHSLEPVAGDALNCSLGVKRKRSNSSLNDFKKVLQKCQMPSNAK